MLAAIGRLIGRRAFDQIPPASVSDRALDLPTASPRWSSLADVRQLAARNRSADDLVCFAGAGAYDHYVPSLVWALAGRSEFSTSYTPYQPELSQGVLQVLFEFQSMICELTGMDVSNASLYDGATALVGGGAHGARRRTRPASWSPAVSTPDSSRRCARTAGERATRSRSGLEAARRRARRRARTSPPWWSQHPNVFGVLEPVRASSSASPHDWGARAIQVFDPLSLGVLAPPGELGADIAVAEGQPLGNHLNFGGPYLGIDRRAGSTTSAGCPGGSSARRSTSTASPATCSRFRRASSTSAARRRTRTSARTRR